MARESRVKVVYDNKDISEDLQKFLKSFTFTDAISGEADGINIVLHDREDLWKGEWLPETSAMLTVSIITKAWWKQDSEEDEELPLGLFEVDEIECGGPPETVNIKAVSVPENNTLRGTEHSRSWEKVKLSVVAGDIAKGAGMTLYYEAPQDPTLERIEQTQQSDLGFLLKACKDNGLALKVTNNQIIVFDEAEYEKKDPAAKITRGADLIKSYKFRLKTREVYKACHVKYNKSKKKENIDYTYTAPGVTAGKTLQVNEQVESVADAERKAKKKLREKNKDQYAASMNLVGAFYFAAGNVYELCGWKKFNGRYIAAKVTHTVGSGYTVAVELRRCLDGY